MLRRFFHYFCIALLLIAQQGAVVHATWHASGGSESHTAHGHDAHDEGEDTGHEAPAGQGSLCAFDQAFGQVMGGVHGACVPFLVYVPSAKPSVFALNPRLSAAAITAQSRGPPALL